MFRHVIAFLVEGEASVYHKQLVNEVASKFFLRKTNVPSYITLKDSFYSDETDIFEEIIERSIKKHQKSKSKKVILNGIKNHQDQTYFINAELSENAKKIHEDIISDLLKIKHVQWDEFDTLDRSFQLVITSNATSDSNMQIADFLSDFKPNFELAFDNIAILRKIEEESTWVVVKRYEI